MVGIRQSDDESSLARGIDVTRVVIHRSLLTLGHQLDTESLSKRVVECGRTRLAKIMLSVMHPYRSDLIVPKRSDPSA